MFGRAGMHGSVIPLYVCRAVSMYSPVITAAAHCSIASLVRNDRVRAARGNCLLICLLGAVDKNKIRQAFIRAGTPHLLTINPSQTNPIASRLSRRFHPSRRGGDASGQPEQGSQTSAKSVCLLGRLGSFSASPTPSVLAPPPLLWTRFQRAQLRSAVRRPCHWIGSERWSGISRWIGGTGSIVLENVSLP